MTPKPFTIRQFTPADLLAVADVEQAVYGSGGYRPLFFRQLFDLAPTLQWVAESSTGTSTTTSARKVVAYVTGAVQQGGETGWILNLAVLAIHRRQGIGRALLQQGVNSLIEAGVSTVKITAEADNKSALWLYQELGFRQTGLGENYYGDGQERAIFEYKPGG